METVQSLVQWEAQKRLTGGAAAILNWWLCVSPSCDVVYFGRTGRPGAGEEPVFRRADLRVPVWFKEPGDDVPLCYCSGLTRGEVKEAVARGCRTIEEVRAATGKTRQGHCLTENPSGRCCHAVLREFIRSQGEP